MKRARASRPVTLNILIFLLVFIGVAALISGPMLFLAPDGHLMQWSVNMLKETPFSNFLIPGIILFLFNGVFPVLVSYGLLRQPAWRWPEAINIFKKYHWSWTASWAAGVIILIWILVETLLLGYISVLQPLITVIGIAIITLTLLPNIRRRYFSPK